MFTYSASIHSGLLSTFDILISSRIPSYASAPPRLAPIVSGSVFAAGAISSDVPCGTPPPST